MNRTRRNRTRRNRTRRITVAAALAAATAFTASACGADDVATAGRVVRGARTVPSVVERYRPVEEAWRHHVGPDVEFTPIAVDGDEVAYAERRDHQRHATLVLATADGEIRWKRPSPLGFGRPHLRGGLVVVSHGYGIAAFSRATGEQAWYTTQPAELDLDKVEVGVGGDLVLATVRAHDPEAERMDVVALRVSDGTLAWRAPLPVDTYAVPKVAGDLVVVSYDDDGGKAGVFALDTATGASLWHRPLPAGPTGGVGVAGGVVAVVCGDMAARGLDLATGEVRWAVDVASKGSAGVAPVAVPRAGGGEDVLVATRLGSMHLIDPATGEQRWASEQVGSAVTGDPVASPDGQRFAMPLYRGFVATAGLRGPTRTIDPPGLLAYAGVTADGLLVTASYDGAPDDAVVAYRDW